MSHKYIIGDTVKVGPLLPGLTEEEVVLTAKRLTKDGLEFSAHLYKIFIGKVLYTATGKWEWIK